MLELRPNCENCNKDLPPQSKEAMICSFECTFCADCAYDVLNNVCPNCGGSFVPRPLRPLKSLAKYPASTKRVIKKEGLTIYESNSVNKRLQITTDRSWIDQVNVHRYLNKKSYWAKKRSLDQVQSSIKGSICFTVLKGERQIGFARVVSDRATYAYIADLFIRKKYQKKGYARKIMESIMEHPDLQTIDRWTLLTKDAHKFYKKFGFRKTKKAKWVMEYLPEGKENLNH